MATETALKVNQANLVKNLRFSFTDTTTVLGELMQNARRAGATKVVIDFIPESKTLVVRDDGCGIDCFQTLLTVAESGWDAELVEREHPFGIGFLSALFACEHLTVESRGRRIAMPTEDILSFKPVAVTTIIRCPVEPRFEGDACGCGSNNLDGPDHEGIYDCYDCGLFFTAEAIGQGESWNGVTTVKLDGFKPEPGKVASRLAALAEGFPIPVVFNGEALKRPWALDSGHEFIQTGVGQVYLKGFGAGEDWTASVEELHVYLQGLPVYQTPRSWHRGDISNVIHLDSSLFHARLPDRDKLVDEDKVVRQVADAVRQEVIRRIQALAAGLEPEAFAKGYDTLRKWDCLELLNDVPAVPRQVLSFIQGYPIKEGAYPVNLEQAATVTREDVETGKVAIAQLECFSEENAPHWMYAWHKGMLVYDHPLHSGHWLHPHMIGMEGQVVDVEIVGETHRANFEGQWVCGDAAFCEKYRLTFDGDTVEIEGDSIYLEDEGLFVVPKGDASGSVVNQACSYFDEHDSYNQSVKDEDDWAFEKFVVANTSANPAKAIERLLPSFAGCPKVFGKRFTLELDPSGKVVSVEELADGKLAGQGMEG